MGLYIPGKNKPKSCEECRKTYLHIPNCPVTNKMVSSWGTAIGCPLEEVDDIAFKIYKAYLDGIEPQEEKKMMKVDHPNGFSGVLYGKSSMVICDENGREVLHTSSRTPQTEEDLYDVLETMPEFLELINERRTYE